MKLEFDSIEEVLSFFERLAGPTAARGTIEVHRQPTVDQRHNLTLAQVSSVFAVLETEVALSDRVRCVKRLRELTGCPLSEGISIVKGTFR